MILECQAHHVDCVAASPPRLPTRVINVRESASQTICLYTPDKSGEFDEYVTLSYCWGGDQPIVALKHNLDDLRDGIAVATLPQTLQDAVRNTRDLGYHYLWVDALCIVQDDNDDITTEMAAMASTYGNSTVTILASTSSSVYEGYLNSPRMQPSFFAVTVNLPNGESGRICIGHPCQWAHFGWHLDPLSKRGWTFQEFLLAKRILFYGQYEVLFHCRNLGFTRLFPSYIRYPDDEQPSSRSLFQSQNKFESWSELLRQYTFRALTFPEDRSRAITGIVTALEKDWNDRCVFGAWVYRFIDQMTWFNVAGFRFHPSLQRSNRAPSWSWLSIDGHVAMSCRSSLRPDCVITANLFEVAKGSKLTLNCRVITEQKWPVLESNLFDVYMDIEKTDESGGKPRSYLYLGSESPLSPKDWYHAFALIVVEESADVFRRIGLIDVHSRNAGILGNIEQGSQAIRHITLI